MREAAVAVQSVFNGVCHTKGLVTFLLLFHQVCSFYRSKAAAEAEVADARGEAAREDAETAVAEDSQSPEAEASVGEQDQAPSSFGASSQVEVGN